MPSSQPSTKPVRPVVAPGDSGGYDRFIDAQVQKTGLQVKLVDLGSALIVLMAGGLGYLLVVIAIDHWIIPLGTGGRWLAWGLLACGAGGYAVRVMLPMLAGRLNPLFAANVIEHSDPGLKNSLINFLLFRADRAGLRASVYQALEHQAAAGLRHVAIETAVDRSRLFKLGYVLAAILALCAAYTILAPKSPFQSAARVLAPWANIKRPSRVRIEEIAPGDCEVFQGERLVVSAHVYDLRSDESVTLHIADLDDRQGPRSVIMRAGAGNLRYEATLPPGDEELERDAHYWIEAGDARTALYQARVISTPVMLVESVEYEYPRYTKLAKRQVERQGDVRAVEGTRVTVRARANQPIAAAVLEFDPPTDDVPSKVGHKRPTGGLPNGAAERIEMEFLETEARGSFVCQLDQARLGPLHHGYQLRFITNGGHYNPQPVLHRIEVVADLPPEVEILTPTADRVEVSEDGWQKFEIRAVDPDYGLTAVRLRAESAGRQVLDRTLLHDPAGRGGQEVVSFDFAPAAIGLRAGARVECIAQAADNRTSSDDDKPAPNIARSRAVTVVITPAAKTRTSAQAPPEAAAQPPASTASSPPKTPPERSPAAAARPDAAMPPDDATQDRDQGHEKDPTDGQSSRTDESGRTDGNAGSGRDQTDGQSDKPNSTDDAAMDGNAQNAGQGGSASAASPQDGGPSGRQMGTQDGAHSGAQSGDQSGDQSGAQSGAQSETASGGQSDNPAGARTASGQNAEDSAGSLTGQPDSGQSVQGAGRAGSDLPTDVTAADDGSNSSVSEANGGAQRAEPLHDGEAFERALSHMQQADARQQPRNAQQGAGGTQPAQQPARSPAGSQRAADSPDTKAADEIPGAGGAAQGQTPAGQSQAPDDLGGKSRSPGGGQNGGPAAEDDGQPAPPGQPAGSEAQSRPDQEPSGNPAEGMRRASNAGSDSAEDRGAGQQGGDQAQQATDEATRPPAEPASGSSPETSSQQTADAERARDAAADTAGGAAPNEGNQSGAGQPQTQPNSSAGSQSPEDVSHKPPAAGGAASQSGDEPQTPSMSHHASSAQSDAGGNQSGGGQQGGGQGGSQPGHDSPGGTTPSDDGAGAAQQSGAGEPGSRPGERQPAATPTGAAGREPDASSQSRSAADGPGDVGGGATPGGTAKPTSGTHRGQDGTTAGQGGSGQPGGGLPGSGDVASGNADGDVPLADAPNVEYARRVTDMVLDYLKDQESHPDEELLKKLGWTPDDLRDFVRRWSELKRNAREDAAAKQGFDDALRSLGLRPTTASEQRTKIRPDSRQTERNVGGRSNPPPTYRELFDAYRKGAGRVADPRP